MSARLWQTRGLTAAGVPELGLYCYGRSQSEAVFRLFTFLLKYYRQLKAFQSRLPVRGLEHLQLLKVWVAAIEEKMTAKIAPPGTAV